jgi:hypothetical protein
MSREALTVGQLIAALEAIRAAHGGDVPVKMADQEPVVRAEWNPGSEGSPACVYISDL